MKGVTSARSERRELSSVRPCGRPPRLIDEAWSGLSTVLALADSGRWRRQPLRGVDTVATYVNSVPQAINGPIVRAGHSYGGVIITNAATGDPNLKALIYIAAFAPTPANPSATCKGNSRQPRPLVPQQWFEPVRSRTRSIALPPAQRSTGDGHGRCGI